MKIIFKLLKKVTLGGFLLYGYNLIAVTFNLIVPINIFTILMVVFFDIPGLFAIIILKLIGV